MAKKITKTKETLMSKPVREVFIHRYAGKVQPVDVAVFIDYQLGQISILDNSRDDYSMMKPKQYIFARRELEYMEGWRDILDGIRSAIEDAEGRLKVYQKERALEEEIEIHRVAQMIASQK